MALIGIQARKANEEQLTAVGGMNGLPMDRLCGLSTIRAFGAEAAVAACPPGRRCCLHTVEREAGCYP